MQRSRPLNLRKYDFLDFRVRGDGNTYLANIRLDQLTGGDEEVWQATLKTRCAALKAHWRSNKDIQGPQLRLAR